MVTATGKRGSNFEAELKATGSKAKIIEISDDKVVAISDQPTFGILKDYIRASNELHEEGIFDEEIKPTELAPMANLRSLEGCKIEAKMIGFIHDDKGKIKSHDERRMKGITKAFAETIGIDDYEDVAYWTDDMLTPARAVIEKIGCFGNDENGDLVTTIGKKVALTDFDNKKWCPKYEKDDPDQFRYNFGDIAIAIIEAIGNSSHKVVDYITDKLLEHYTDDALRDAMRSDITFKNREDSGLHDFIRSIVIPKL
jgi:hypothetical protein